MEEQPTPEIWRKICDAYEEAYANHRITLNREAYRFDTGLEALNGVYMDYNENLSSIEPLVNCPRLVQVKVYGTSVAEVKSLLDMDVVVEFDPTLRMEE